MQDNVFKMSLRAARLNAKISSMEKAADLIGVHKDTIRNWEIGKSIPRADQVPAIEKAYKIPYDNIDFTN